MSTRETRLRADALAVLLPGFVGTTVPPGMAERLRDGLAGLWLFGHNVSGPEQVSALCAQVHGLAPAALVASDEEGGTVSRLHHAEGSPYPGHLALGRVDDPGLTRAVAGSLGAELHAVGIDLAAAPDADVNSEPQNPVIGVRSFGADPALVTRHTGAYVAGLREGGVLACAKHFPGHGSTRQDSHLTLPRVDADRELLRRRDLPPFAAAVQAGVEVLMTAHLVVPDFGELPATLNPAVLRLAREELGFTGVLCTDALDMHAVAHGVGRDQGAVLALTAGVDLLCVGNPAFPEAYDAVADLDELVAAIVAGVHSGRLGRARLAEAAGRVRALGVRQAERRAGGPHHPHEEADGRSIGLEAARRALEVDGVLPGALPRPVLAAASGAVNIASGARQEVLLAQLAAALPGTTRLPSEQGPAPGTSLVLVTDDRTNLAAERVQRLLGCAAIVVHTGFAALPDGLSPAPVVRTFGGGLASGQALAERLAASLSPPGASAAAPE